MDREDIFIVESPIAMIAGETITYSVDWLGATTLENPAMAIYCNGKDISSTSMVIPGDFEISGSVLTLKKITAKLNDGGATYVALIQCTVDKNVERRKLVIEISKANFPSN